MVRYFRELAPDVVVIDLDRLPSHGRELGVSSARQQEHEPSAAGLRRWPPGEDRTRARRHSRRRLHSVGQWLAPAIERAMAQPEPPRFPHASFPKPSAPARSNASWTSNRKLTSRLFRSSQPHHNDEPWLSELLVSIPDGAVQQRRIDTPPHSRCFPSQAAAISCGRSRTRALVAAAEGILVDRPSQADQPAGRGLQPRRRPRGRTRPGPRRLQGFAVDKDWSALKFARRGVTKARPHAMRRP